MIKDTVRAIVGHKYLLRGGDIGTITEVQEGNTTRWPYVLSISGLSLARTVTCEGQENYDLREESPYDLVKDLTLEEEARGVKLKPAPKTSVNPLLAVNYRSVLPIESIKLKRKEYSTLDLRYDGNKFIVTNPYDVVDIPLSIEEAKAFVEALEILIEQLENTKGENQ